MSWLGYLFLLNSAPFTCHLSFNSFKHCFIFQQLIFYYNHIKVGTGNIKVQKHKSNNSLKKHTHISSLVFPSIKGHSILVWFTSMIYQCYLHLFLSVYISLAVSGGVRVSLKRGADSTVMWMIEAGGLNSASSSVFVCVCVCECVCWGMQPYCGTASQRQRRGRGRFQM